VRAYKVILIEALKVETFTLSLDLHIERLAAHIIVKGQKDAINKL
jgi:hypothetical protein